MQIESLPYTTNGKIDRKNLPDPKYNEDKKEISLPRNETDSKLIELVKALLVAEIISIDDNFFDIGGDSLSAINLCIKIQDKFGVQLFVKDVLEHPTVKELSDIIDSNEKSEKIVINKVAKAENYDVSAAQKRIYFASKMAGNNSILYKIKLSNRLLIIPLLLVELALLIVFVDTKKL